jgi:hypothetical protein
MARWPVLVGFAISSTLFGSLGCAASPSVTPGLANAPRLGGTGGVDDGAHDVVANGRDSCESVTGRSPLRGHLPACPTASHPVASLPPMLEYRTQSMVVPWLEHFYVGWPCTHSAAAVQSRTVAWSSQPPAMTACNTPGSP